MKLTQLFSFLELGKSKGQAASKDEEDLYSKPCDFETAVSATGFGLFNILLMLVAIPASWASIFETTTMSYVFTVAHCDLNLSLDDKGWLNAITYMGMITSASIWGFLFDTLGRRKLLVMGFLLDGILVFLSTLSQSITLLMVTKFFGGFIINGPFAAITSYCSEFHAAKYRPIIQMILGAVNSLGSIMLPLLAWLILPRNLDFNIFGLNFHSWNVYLFICGLPSFISGLIFFFLPESPKFLMTTGNNDKALEVFRKVYRFNTRKPAESFPVNELIDEIQLHSQDAHKHGGQITANRTKIQALKEGWQQMTPLFFHPHRAKLILVCSTFFLIVMSLNMLRLWMPQIFQAINDYQQAHNGTSSDVCTMLQGFQKKSDENHQCFVNLDNSEVYINSMIVGLTTLLGNSMAGLTIRAMGKKKILFWYGIAGGICCMCIYLSQDVTSVIAWSSATISLGSAVSNVLLAVTVDLFPTTLRTMTVALGMMFARLGAMGGNLLVPFLLESGCEPPFFFIGSVTIGFAFLSMALPNTDNKALE